MDENWLKLHYVENKIGCWDVWQETSFLIFFVLLIAIIYINKLARIYLSWVYSSMIQYIYTLLSLWQRLQIFKHDHGKKHLTSIV